MLILGLFTICMLVLLFIRLFKQAIRALYGMAPYFILFIIAMLGMVYIENYGNNARNFESIENQSGSSGHSEQWFYDQIPSEFKPWNKSR